eukprot:4496023-Prymnesium_polylepis.1
MRAPRVCAAAERKAGGAGRRGLAKLPVHRREAACAAAERRAADGVGASCMHRPPRPRPAVVRPRALAHRGQTRAAMPKPARASLRDARCHEPCALKCIPSPPCPVRDSSGSL